MEPLLWKRRWPKTVDHVLGMRNSPAWAYHGARSWGAVGKYLATFARAADGQMHHRSSQRFL